MPINLHGKMYTGFAERMKILVEELGKEYSIITEYEIKDNYVIVSARIEAGGQKYTGHAIGVLDAYKSNPKAKIIEATETHALGRALASFGIMGGDEFEFASANEIADFKATTPPRENDFEKYIPAGDDSDVVTFGKKYKGVPWSEVSDDYIMWGVEKCSVPWQQELFEKERQRRAESQDNNQEQTVPSGDTKEIPF